MQSLRRSICRQCVKRVTVSGSVKPLLGPCTSKLFTTGKPERAEHDKLVKLRWFEQSGDDSTRKPVGELGAAEDDEAKELRVELEKEDAELREMKRDFSPEELKELENAMEEAKLGENFDDLFNAEEDEDDSDLEDDEDLDLEDAVGLSGGRTSHATKRARTPKESQYSPFNIQLYLSEDQRPYLEQLNKALRQASVEAASRTTQELLWRWYTKCKQTLPPFLSLIPDPSWKVLEKSTRHRDLASEERATRSRVLLDDIKNAGRSLDRSTRLAYIELLLEEGRPLDAARQWKQDEVALRADGDLALQFEETGVRVFAAAEDIQKAQQLALGRMLQKVGPKSKSLIPLIAAWARSGDEDGLKRAWVFYDQFKQYMGSDMTLNDYDRIAKIFVHADRIDLSLAVFKDYVQTTRFPKSASREQYDPSPKTLKRMLSQTSDPGLISEISLIRLAMLPPKYNNKYFYASWMKRLIAADNNEAALEVVQYMYNQGVAPDAKHLNGIVGAWLRSGNIKDKEKAIRLAWSMILNRVDFVGQRSYEALPGSRLLHFKMYTRGLLPTGDNSAMISLRVTRPLPHATIETFCLLLQYYERRNMLGYVNKVQLYLRQAQIPPNSYFMNHLLYAQLRRGNYDGVWKGYRRMSEWVRQDLETFACLWDTQKGHLGKVAFRERQQRPQDTLSSPRLLFCEMAIFMGRLTRREQQATRESMSQELYDQIVRCFCLANDIEGTFVCLHALKKSFGLYPDENIARMVSIQVSRLGEGTAERPGRRRKRVPRLKINLNRAAQVLGLLGEERGKALARRGISVESMDERFREEESLYLLTSMLRVVLEKQLPEGTDVQQRFESVAWEMGVSGVYMGDHLEKPEVPDPFDVDDGDALVLRG